MSTITITVAYEVSAAAFARVQALAKETVLRDINFSGAKIRVVRDDFTAVKNSKNEIRDTGLLTAVFSAIDGE